MINIPTVDITYGLVQLMNDGTLKVPYTLTVVDYPKTGDRHQFKSGIETYTPDPELKTNSEMITEIRNSIKGKVQAEFDKWRKCFDLNFEKFRNYTESVEVTVS